MTDTNYEKYLFLKYSVGVAIAVIKSKPENKSLIEYINELKTMIQSQKDPFENVSICSRDFLYDSDKESPDEHINKSFHKTRQELATDYGLNEPVESPCNCSAFIENPNVIRFEEHNQNLDRNDSIKEIIDIFNDTQETHQMEVITSTPRHITQSTNCESENTSQKRLSNVLRGQHELEFCTEATLCKKMPEMGKIKNTSENNKSNDGYDSQATELYTFNGFTDNFTYISQSQDNIIVLNKGLRKSPKANTICYNLQVDEINNTQNRNVNKIVTQHFSPNYCMSSCSKDEPFKMKPEKANQDKNCADIFKKSSDARISDINEEKREMTCFAGSYRQNTSNSEKSNPPYKDVRYIPSDSSTSGYGFLLTGFDNVNNKLNDINMETLNKKHLSNVNSPLCHTENSKEKEHDSSLSPNITRAENNWSLADADRPACSDDQYNSLNCREKTHFNIKEYYNNLDGHLPQSHVNLNNIIEFRDDTNNCKCKQFSLGYNTECMSKNNILEEPDGMEDVNSDIAETRSDVAIPFKVLEELNRVKNYINKQERRLSDSGRSNSQSFSLKSGSQLSGVRINESGHCLLNFLLNCSTTDNTMDITEEISRVLGKLIDKLHEDENYPPFLEIILESVRELIKEICDGSRNTEDLFIKEEKMDRLLLLNRSANVIKYTTEQVTPILEDLHLKLKNKDILEISTLEKTENLCYIFNILEILLKRNKSAISLSSRTSTQGSQEEERCLKRNAITEIWRKKWNLSKGEVNEVSYRKTYIFTQLSEILNKIIVEGMDGYGLISFAALQCFNLLQSK